MGIDDRYKVLSMPKIIISRTVERDLGADNVGSHFSGSLTLLDTTLLFTVAFPEGTDWFMGEEEEDIEDMKKRCVINVINGTTPVSLTEDEYAAFYYIVGTFAIDLDRDPLMRDLGQPTLAKHLRALGATGTQQLSEQVTCEADQEFCDIFMQAKFRN